MINTKKQAIYFIFIILGAVLLVYDLVYEPASVYFKIIGLVVLMVGLYTSTRQWASDNPRNENVSDKTLTNDEERPKHTKKKKIE